VVRSVNFKYFRVIKIFNTEKTFEENK
jgi:hypothetical protein